MFTRMESISQLTKISPQAGIIAYDTFDEKCLCPSGTYCASSAAPRPLGVSSPLAYLNKLVPVFLASIFRAVVDAQNMKLDLS